MSPTELMETKAKPKRLFIKVFGLVVLLAIGYCGWRFGPTVYDLWRKGVFTKPEQKEYEGTNVKNLQALRTALMLFHDSEGQFPKGESWMDDITPRLKTYQFGDSALKKLIRPDLLPEKEGVYGYAMNDVCAGKYKDDVKDPDATPLIFVSKDTSKNAHGNPKDLLPSPPTPGGNVGISVSGKILKL